MCKYLFINILNIYYYFIIFIYIYYLLNYIFIFIYLKMYKLSKYGKTLIK